jgi:hypothetical protein
MATKEAVFSLRVDTGNSVQDIQNADQAIKNFNKDLQTTQATAASGTGISKMEGDLTALNKKISAGGLTIREMTQAMKQYQNIATIAGTQSPVGQEALQRTIQLKNEIRDLKNTTNVLSKDFVGMNTVLAGLGTGAAVFQGIQGAAALAGIENEDLQKTLVKLQATQGLVNTVNTIAQGLQKDAILGIQLRTAAEKIRNFVLGQTTTATTAQAVGEVELGTATVATTIATTASTTAMKALKVALISTGIGALIVGLGLLVANLEEVGNFLSGTTEKEKELEKQRKKTNEALREQSKEVAKESGAFTQQILRLKATNEGSKERTKLINEVNKTYGTTLTNLKDEAKFQASLNVELASYLEYQKAKYQLQKNEKAIIANLEKQDELSRKLFDSQQKIDKARKDGAGKQKRTLEEGIITYVNVNEKADKSLEAAQKTISQTQIELDKAKGRFENYGKAANDAQAAVDKLTNGGKKFGDTETTTTTAVDKTTAAIENQIDAFQRELDAIENAENLKISMMTEGKAKQLAILEDTYGDFRNDLIKKANKTEIDSLDEKFKKGTINEQEYRDQLKTIMETGANNFSEAENNLMTLTTEKLNDDKRRLNLTAQELEIDDINKSFDQKDITEAERLIKIQEINDNYEKIKLDKEAENETKRKNRANLLNGILLNETQLAIQKEIDLFDEQKKELDRLLLSKNENEKITQEEHDKAMIELKRKKEKAIEDINKGAADTKKAADQKAREEELAGITAGLEAAKDALDKIKMVNDLLNEIGTARINKINEERDEDLANLDAKQKAELSAVGLTAEQKTGIEEKFAKQKYDVQLAAFNQEDKINRAKFNRDKAIKLAEVGINTASAIVKGIAEFGPPPSPAGIAAILTAGVIGTTQALAITNQKYQGGSAPTMPSVSNSGGGGLAGSSASSFTSQPTTQTSTTGLNDNGQSVTAPVQVFVLENDISSTQNKVAVQESKSSF